MFPPPEPGGRWGWRLPAPVSAAGCGAPQSAGGPAAARAAALPQPPRPPPGGALAPRSALPGPKAGLVGLLAPAPRGSLLSTPAQAAGREMRPHAL